MACHGARRLIEMNRNLGHIIGIELLVSAQGISFRQPLKTSKPLSETIGVMRSQIPALENDRYMAEELKLAQRLVFKGRILKGLESYLPGLSGGDSRSAKRVSKTSP